MPVFEKMSVANHEQVMYCNDPASGLKAIIAIHNSKLGPAAGGCRMRPYASEDEALDDVLRLSRGMTYKSAMARIPFGGAKSVILGDPHTQKTEALLRAMGRFIDRLGGHYITGVDSGTTTEDMKIICLETSHVGGLLAEAAKDGEQSAALSAMTSHGVFFGIRAALRFALGREDLRGVKVAIQGVGNVGSRLAQRLKEAGAKIWICDVSGDAAREVAEQTGARVVAPEDIYGIEADVFSPCALGGILNEKTLSRLRCKIVAGAANNQLAGPGIGRRLMEQGVLYAPDYVINAGGIIGLHYEREGYDIPRLKRHVEGIFGTLLEIFGRSAAEKRPTDEIADRMAEERLA